MGGKIQSQSYQPTPTYRCNYLRRGGSGGGLKGSAANGPPPAPEDGSAGSFVLPCGVALGPAETAICGSSAFGSAAAGLGSSLGGSCAAASGTAAASGAAAALSGSGATFAVVGSAS